MRPGRGRLRVDHSAYCFYVIHLHKNLHVARRTAVQQTVAVVNAAERPRRSHRPAAGTVVMRVQPGDADPAAEKSGRLSAGDAYPAVYGRPVTDAGVVVIRPRRRRRPRLPAHAAVQAQRGRIILEIGHGQSGRGHPRYLSPNLGPDLGSNLSPNLDQNLPES